MNITEKIDAWTDAIGEFMKKSTQVGEVWTRVKGAWRSLLEGIVIDTKEVTRRVRGEMQIIDVDGIKKGVSMVP